MSANMVTFYLHSKRCAFLLQPTHSKRGNFCFNKGKNILVFIAVSVLPHEHLQNVCRQLVTRQSLDLCDQGLRCYNEITEAASSMISHLLSQHSSSIHACERYTDFVASYSPIQMRCFQRRLCLLQQDTPKAHSAHITTEHLRNVQVLNWPDRPVTH